MKQQSGLERYTQYVRNEAYQKLYNDGIEPTGYGNDQEYWTAFHKAAKAAEVRLNGPGQPRRRSREADVRAPVQLPVLTPAPTASALDRISVVGALRGLHLVAAPNGGFSLTLKATLHSGQKVYRYGYIERLDQVEEVLSRWLEKGYWTPDKQENRK
jgi:hypothetical protein